MHRKDASILRFASARCLEIVSGTIASPTSAPIVERVTGRSTSACRTILRSSLLVVFLVAPDPVFHAWVPSRVHCSQQFLTAHYELSTWPTTRCVDQPAVFIPMIRPLSNSLNCEKSLLARLPGMFRFSKSSYNRRLSSDLFSVWFGNSSNDRQARRRFVEWAQNEIAVVLDFHKRILFSNEAHFWLNGYVNKQNCRIRVKLIHKYEPQTLDHFEDNIRRVIADIRPQMLEKVIENWTSRLDYIRASRGSHMPEIIFKM
ncbi:uncharacterized protein TNCV_2946891 [Trichonephila clavipes]|nr:uncharacterized protein TNCV_2946891 [Trichonephila clavipes]